MKHPRLLLAGILASLAVTSWAAEEATTTTTVTLPTIFGDHMVLQRDLAVPIWGTAAPGKKVTVRFRSQVKATIAGANGTWSVKLDPLSAGGPDNLTINDENITDVLVGEVWIGSGQSNMAVGYNANKDTSVTATGMPYRQVRILGSDARRKTTWREVSEQTSGGFSAILLHFGVRLHTDLGVPVGLMCGAVGGSSSAWWISDAAFREDPACLAAAKKLTPNYDADFGEYKIALTRWQETGAKSEKRPIPPALSTLRNGRVGANYENKIRPFVGFGIRGVVWDQGEGAVGLEEIDQYTLMSLLIRSWRKDWGQGDFPFIYVQKPSGGGCAWDYKDPMTRCAQKFTALPAAVPESILGKLDSGSGLTSSGSYRPIAAIRGSGDCGTGMTRDDAVSFLKLMTYPNAGMAISTDLGGGLHPENKFGYGNRAAQVALGMVYGRAIEYYGPLYASHSVEGNTVRVKFTHVGKGLAFRNGEKLQGFAVAGADKTFQWADATIDGDTVLLTAAAVPEPVFVRYAWSANHQWANFFNKDGLPAIPFRTDP